jgi:hypothetical protein
LSFIVPGVDIVRPPTGRTIDFQGIDDDWRIIADIGLKLEVYLDRLYQIGARGDLKSGSNDVKMRAGLEITAMCDSA